MYWIGALLIGVIGGLAIPIYDFSTKALSVRNLIIQILALILWIVIDNLINSTKGETK